MAEHTATMSCRCGRVTGTLQGAAPARVNRVVCYCDDCQAFAHWLGRADLLDAHGGSDIVQVAPAAFTIDSGHAEIACLRLGPKGVHRFYARCCNTPVGNTVKPTIPFVGLPVQVFTTGGQDPDRSLGPSLGGIMARFAIGRPANATDGFGLMLVLRAMARVLWWRLSGQARPHPLLEDNGDSRYPVRVLTKEERDALRPLCGPRP